MIRSRFVLLLLVPLAGALLAQDPAEGRAVRPNVVIIYTDDQGYADLGCQGARDFTTPNLDALAASGVRFTDFYVAQPVCSASRAALMTGCYPNRIGIAGALVPTSKVGISDRETTLAELLRAHGFATAIFGKWHLGREPRFLPTHHGFDEYLGIPYSNDMGPKNRVHPERWPPLPTLEGDEVLEFDTDQATFTRLFTDRALSFIRRSHEAGKPFFCYLPHPMPHTPIFASGDFAGSSKQGLYGDVIQEIDASVGRILRELDELGIREDTLVMFASDNGPWLNFGNHAGSAGPLREGKGTTFEGGIRVPCIFSWPGHLPAGKVQHEPAMTIDILPTLAKLIGAPLPDLPIDGLDIWPLIACVEGARSPHEALFFWYHAGDLEAMRCGNWKLHFPHGYRTMIGREMGKDGLPGDYDNSARIGLALFDLASDVGETHDVAAENEDVVARLSRLADAMRARLGDRLRGTKGSENREPGRIERDDSPEQPTKAGTGGEGQTQKKSGR